MKKYNKSLKDAKGLGLKNILNRLKLLKGQYKVVTENRKGWEFKFNITL